MTTNAAVERLTARTIADLATADGLVVRIIQQIPPLITTGILTDDQTKQVRDALNMLEDVHSAMDKAVPIIRARGVDTTPMEGGSIDT